ncbi:hypothetical protein NLG97_g1762 [Lecanicillium saksenae]|uniref:Uncharacterized protein n=1 Tax=Lecanicillium saksenae TaxID=468837 RepID=A0ACC1R472_9HYPO|nr:hypothetical protein NLG97_g1762 [Lecanicillium saksenae]
MADSVSGEPRAYPNEDYTVGWICALDTEYIAAQVFLEEKHAPPTSVATHDNNDYTLGRIGRHNVAIAVMPGGEYGTASAAVTATDMLHTFSNIRIGLMVGIGGGAPSPKNDIRLGDIVVSMPQNGLGGVLQYDFGKTIQDQPFQLTRFLAPPPRALLTAVTGLKAEYAIEGHTIQEDIEACLAAKQRLRKRFGRPDSETDILYSSTAIHEPGVESCLVVCGIKPGSIVSRQPREEHEDDPVVHYGTIASANQLMKDARLRDQYAIEKNVLCFEMEAGGLMNHFPCIVIRGICDYSDTHKNKDWQGHAAMTAAAYAKDLIGRISPERLQSEKKIKDVMDNVLCMTMAIKDNVKSIQADAYLAKITEWLSAPDPSSNLNKARELYQHGTGQWLLDSHRYQSWMGSPSSFLWLYGIPGCGKTILSSTVIANLQQQDRPSRSLLYFYFDFTDTTKRSTENAVRSLICQLYHKQAATREILKSVYEKTAKFGTKPGIQMLITTLKAMLDNCETAWIVLDGLDECETRDQHATDGVMRWIEQDIKSTIQSWADEERIIPLQSNLVADDIGAYIDTAVSQIDRWRKRPDIQESIKTTLKSKADGMFRWVSCQLDTLKTCLDPARVHYTLATLPQTLDETYARILQRLPFEYKPTARRLLQLLTYSKRPLTIEEAVDAIAVEPGSSCRFDPEYRMPIPEEITRYCSSLVSLVIMNDEFRNTQIIELQLAHFSVQEYLRSSRVDPAEAMHFGQRQAAEDLTNLCLSYLLVIKPPPVVKQLPERFSPTTPVADIPLGIFNDLDEQLQQLKEDYPFAEFSARYWYDFANILESSTGKVLEIVEEYFSNNRALTLGYLLPPLEEDAFDDYMRVPPLYYAACVGLKHSVCLLLKMNADVNATNGHRSTALHVASLEGHYGIVQMLIQHGADVNAVDESHLTALVYASSKGHLAIVELLIDNGAKVNIQCGDYGDALYAASGEGHEDIVEALIQHGADINAQGGEYGNALIAASIAGYEEVIKALIKHGVEVNAQGGDYGNALQAASALGRKEAIKILLQHGAEVNAQGGRYGNALQAALASGSKEAIEILLQHGAEGDA